MAPPRRYAEGTTVSVESSRGTVTGILAAHGVQKMGWTSDPIGDALLFELDGRSYRMRVVRPTVDELRQRDGPYYSYPHNVDWQSRLDPEWRRRWRALVLLLKAKLEFAEDDGPSTVMRELMPYALLRDGRTLEEAIEADGLPLLAEVNR